MATYLKHYQLERAPFEGRGNEQIVLATASLRRAFAQIKAGLEEDSPRICITGGEGIGKSSLARALPKLLAKDARAVLIREPSVDWTRVKASIVKQLELSGDQISRSALLEAREDGKRIVFVIDRAEELPADSLEHLDVILGYRDEQGAQLVRCVLLANLASAPRGGDVPLLWWLDRLTTRQLTFAPIPEKGIRSYIDKHLTKAGWSGGALFTDDAIVAIHRYTGGVPGAMSELCEDLLAKSADAGSHEIDGRLVAMVCGDELPLSDEVGGVPEDELPLFEERPDTPKPVQSFHPDPPAPVALEPEPEPEPESESELRIHQGLLPDDEAETAAREDFFSDDHSIGSPRHASTSSGARPKGSFSYPPSPGSGRTARMVRNLTMLALLACVAVGLHLWISSDTAPEVIKKAKVITKAQVLERAQALEKLVPEQAAPTVAAVPATQDEDHGEPESSSAGSDDAEGGDPAVAPKGLTSDLKLRREVAGDSEAAGTGPAATAKESSEKSLSELYELAEQAKKDPEAFEPWAEQAPESAGPAAPSATRP